MDLYLEALKRIRNPEIYTKELIPYVEKRIPFIFGIACEKNLSVNEWQPDSSFIKLNQKTVFITVRMFDLWETALVDIFNRHLKDIGIKVAHSHSSIGDLVLIFPDGKIMNWEIKTSQAGNSFTGATHSSSKCDNYILINYSIDKDKKLSLNENYKFIKEMAVFVWDDMKAKWMGEPSKNNSFTTLKIPSEIIKTRPEIVVVGKLNAKTKWCKFVREERGNYKL